MPPFTADKENVDKEIMCKHDLHDACLKHTSAKANNTTDTSFACHSVETLGEIFSIETNCVDEEPASLKLLGVNAHNCLSSNQKTFSQSDQCNNTGVTTFFDVENAASKEKDINENSDPSFLCQAPQQQSTDRKKSFAVKFQSPKTHIGSNDRAHSQAHRTISVAANTVTRYHYKSIYFLPY